MKSSITFLFALTILVSLSCNQDKSKDFSTAQKTFETMITAARQDNIDRFVDCLDKEYFKKYAQANYPDKQITDEMIKNTMKMVPKTRELINGFKKFEFSILYEKDVGINARELTVVVIPKEGSGYTNEEQVKFIFIKRDNTWRLDLKSSFDL